MRGLDGKPWHGVHRGKARKRLGGKSRGDDEGGPVPKKARATVRNAKAPKEYSILPAKDRPYTLLAKLRVRELPGAD